jgi:hypothetical protein
MTIAARLRQAENMTRPADLADCDPLCPRPRVIFSSQLQWLYSKSGLLQFLLIKVFVNNALQ